MRFNDLLHAVLCSASILLVATAAQGQDCGDAAVAASSNQVSSAQAQCNAANGATQSVQTRLSAANKKLRKNNSKANQQKVKNLKKELKAAKESATSVCAQIGSAQAAHDAFLGGCALIFDANINSGTEDQAQKAVFLQRIFDRNDSYADLERTRRLTLKLSTAGWNRFNNVDEFYQNSNSFVIRDINDFGEWASVVPDLDTREQELINGGASDSELQSTLSAFAETLKGYFAYELKADDLDFGTFQNQIVTRFWTSAIFDMETYGLLPRVGSTPFRLVQVISPRESGFHYRCAANSSLFAFSIPADIELTADQFPLRSALQTCMRSIN